MATWVAHFRLAEALLEHGFDLDRQMFVMGNIAPDSGVLNAEKNGYVPSKVISHWRDGNDINPEQFYADELAGKTFDTAETAFRLGYYCHLLADVVWIETVWRPKKATKFYAELLAKDPQFIWEIKKDWYGLDFIYLQEHPQSIFFTDFVHIQNVPDYLPQFPAGAFNKRLNETRDFYLADPDWDLNRPYIYLSREEYDAFISTAFEAIKNALHAKGVNVRS